MNVKFSFNLIDDGGNTCYCYQKIKDIKVSAKGRIRALCCNIEKTLINNRKAIRKDDSLCIIWQIEYFDNIYNRDAIPIAENDYQAS
jgi:hypothetical protein